MEDIINVNDLADMQRMITDKTRNKIETGLSENQRNNGYAGGYQFNNHSIDKRM